MTKYLVALFSIVFPFVVLISLFRGLDGMPPLAFRPTMSWLSEYFRQFSSRFEDLGNDAQSLYDSLKSLTGSFSTLDWSFSRDWQYSGFFNSLGKVIDNFVVIVMNFCLLVESLLSLVTSILLAPIQLLLAVIVTVSTNGPYIVDPYVP